MNSKVMFNKPFNSSSLELQSKRLPNGLVGKLLSKGKIFPFAIATETISTAAVKDFPPSAMRKAEKDKIKPLFWNEEELFQESFSMWSQIYFMFSALVRVFLFLFLPLFYILLFVGLAFGEGGWDEREKDFYDVTLYIFIPLLIPYLHYKLVSQGYFFLAPFLRSKPLFRLNRTEGTVTLYKDNGEVNFTHPFIEFDCVLMSSPTAQGHLNYVLTLAHRYNNYSVGVPLHTLIGSNQMVAEYHRLWNMIQRYMDVSQPMPDIMVLEPSRSRDAITETHDKCIKRPTRYWRDMSDEEFSETIEKIRQEQEENPSFGHVLNIFKDD
ncbi:hypothetical protein GCE9029_05031 [Grimontia celer]|uniref:Uncharacterized protein n=1 Tax=Grimontia celer TaxID=1796497 RepID=A0A128FGT2_9GAMM|nr:hypothetical protein [Grimontia celer]CZF85471.1 hypothetical protein GCE9029_05031 [Grimontia celer]